MPLDLTLCSLQSTFDKKGPSLVVYIWIIWFKLIDDTQKIRVNRVRGDEVCLIGDVVT